MEAKAALNSWKRQTSSMNKYMATVDWDQMQSFPKEESATIAFSQNDNLQITLIYIDRNYQFVEPKSFIILVSHYLWRDKYMVTFNKTCYTATLTLQSDVATIIARNDDLFSLMDPH